MTQRGQLVVVGNGMVGHKFLLALADAGALERWDVTTFAEESRPAYDRVALSSYFNGATAEDLSLVEPGRYDALGITVHYGDRVESIDTTGRHVRSVAGNIVNYDALVLATGSYPFVPPIPGHDLPGTFVYRTIEDLEAIAEAAMRPMASVGTVIGGGLLGLEAANALHTMGLTTHVVEFAPRLMPVQVDEAGGRALRRRIEDRGVSIHLGRQTTEVVANANGRVSHLSFADDEHPDLATDLLVFSAGIRPRDDLARLGGLEVGERGGIIVDPGLATSAVDVYAIGECALVDGRIYGLVAPGYDMARALARRLAGAPTSDPATRFEGADMSTKLKLLGVDVASFGDAHSAGEDCREIVYDDPVAGVYKKLVVSSSGDEVRGGILVGDATGYHPLAQMARGERPTPSHPELLICPDRGGHEASSIGGIGALAPAATVCSCENITKGGLCAAVSAGASTVGDLKLETGAGTGCGGCVPLMTEVLREALAKEGVELSSALCEHFELSRQDLFDVIRVRGYESFSAVLGAHGRGLGCEICKPTVASILASQGNGYILDGEQASLQDTNDAFLANLQRDGTYSVVPRIPGGEVTPDGLIAIGQVARDFGLYTKITGGQRIDLLGARVEQLPPIWERLIAAGFESGHAYGKSLRTVKSCVGENWCRYGVGDSTSLAIGLELRYRGLRSPHKIKMAVSGCSRECAEAQSKDVGVIATERGWNLYVGGNGGQRPRHAVLFAGDLDTGELIRLIDRFLMFYVRTADRLQRTASWLEQLDGGVDHLRRVVVDDALGLCADFDAEMGRHIDSYECEWQATLDRPEAVARFVTFVNAPDQPDPTVVFVRERGQIRPATAAERDREVMAR